MANETLRASQAQVDAMFDSEAVPDQLVGDITLADLSEIIDEMVTAEVRAFNETELPDNEGEEALREMIERIALKIGLICMNIAPTPVTGFEIPVDSDTVAAVLADLLRSGGATLTLRVNH
jgi:hypothetical protein